MTEYILTEKSNLVAVADSVRKRTEETDHLTLGEMIDDISYVIGSADTPEDAIITRTLSSYTNSRVSEVGEGAFAYCTPLTTVSFPIATTIGDYAFRDCNNLTTVSFPIATTIGDYAFWDCNNLTTVSFPIATTIGNYAFTGCDSLTSANFSAVTTLNSYAFDGCKNLTTVSFPAITTIGDSTFANCKNLTTVSFPIATTIGNFAFEGCSSLTAVNFPAVTTIGGSAFKSCSSLTTVNFPIATTINAYAFAYCTRLVTVSFPAVTTIKDFTFPSCNNLISVNFPIATTIDYGAFWKCSRLATINFPKATSIGNYAFESCPSLATVSFPAVTTIGSSAFAGCNNLRSLYLTGSSLCTLSNSNAFASTPIGGYSTSAGTYGSIYVPLSLFTAYQKATNWTYFASRFIPLGFYFSPINTKQIALVNSTTSMSTDIFIVDGTTLPTVTINSDNEQMVSIANVTISNGTLTFDVITNEIEGESIITINATDGNYSQTESFIIKILQELPSQIYTVENIDEASYGFELNNNGYYESTNKGIDDSYAMCKLSVYTDIDTNMYIDCINYAESSYDYGLLSNLDTTLTLTNDADSANVYHSFEDKQSSNIQTVTYNVPAGEHFIYIKFIKDGSAADNNDTLQFTVRWE